MALQPGTNKQLPENSVFDALGKQTYLGNQYTYPFNTNATGSAEVPFILIRNPAVTLSTFPANYVSLFINLKKLSVLTASQNGVLRFYLSPTFSAAGTPQTAVNLRPASPNVSSALITTVPTVSVNGTLVEALGTNAFLESESKELMILDPGQTLLATLQPSGNLTVIGQFNWYEL